MSIEDKNEWLHTGNVWIIDREFTQSGRRRRRGKWREYLSISKRTHSIINNDNFSSITTTRYKRINRPLPSPEVKRSRRVVKDWTGTQGAKIGCLHNTTNGKQSVKHGSRSWQEVHSICHCPRRETLRSFLEGCRRLEEERFGMKRVGKGA